MSDVTRPLDVAVAGGRHAAAQLFPLVYDDLHKLVAAKMAHEESGQSHDAAALVLEAYLRLIGGQSPQDWDGRGHFFAATAEAMPRILVDQARSRMAAKRIAGRRVRIDLDGMSVTEPDDDVLAVHAGLAGGRPVPQLMTVSGIDCANRRPIPH